MSVRQPYDDIKILDLTHVLAGPFCTYQFALMGADVIKIEPPDNPDCARGRGPDPQQNAALRGLNYQAQAANKRAMALDLKCHAGREIFLRLIETADILVENYCAGALESLGLGYDQLAARNPRLIYCSLTGFGEGGPRTAVGAYDNVIQASAGVIEQSAGHKPGLSFVDYATGYAASFAIAAALAQRQQTGCGVKISTSMFEVAMTLMAPEAAAELYPIKSRRSKEAGICAYETAEGVFMAAAFTPDQNVRFWRLLEHEGYAFDARFKQTPDWQSLWAKSDAMRSVLGDIMKTRTAAQWQELMHDNDLPGERRRALAEAVLDEQLKERAFFFQSEQGTGDAHPPELPGAAFRFSEGGWAYRSPPPSVGEHTNDILAELGIGADEMAQLRADGAIG